MEVEVGDVTAAVRQLEDMDINFLAGGRMSRQHDPQASVIAPAAASVVVPKVGSGANYSFLSVLLSRVIVWVGVAASVHNRFMTMT